mmetsp:Transcript_94256/g.288383  ORF Transcript_94256/g.288383 Transcript_94256/m.288383 type:complete len:234 (+) Transcript_94256:106-807(+)
MWDFWQTMPMRGASLSTPAIGRWTCSYHCLYSAAESKMVAEQGCQMPKSGSTTGSMMRSKSITCWLATEGTYCPATRISMASRFSGVPPSQCCSERMKVLASLAWSPGKNLSTFGKVRTSFKSPSWKLPPEGFFPWPPSACWRTSFTCCAKEPSGPPVIAVRSNEPSLFNFITSGMDGKHRQADRRSRKGCTTSTSFSASSCTKMREQMNTFASSRSFRKASNVWGSRISSNK